MKYLLCLAFVSASFLAPAAERKKPNILFFFADDWGRYASAYAGMDGRPTANDIIKTPNVDRIAKNGVLFRNAFVNAPSCTPCRSSLCSGRYFFNTGMGAILQGAKWDPAIPAWPLLLRDSGYHIGKTWKVWGPGIPADAPIGAQEYAHDKTGNRFSNFSEEVTKLVRGGMAVGAAKDNLFNDVRVNFDDFLDSWSKEKDKPFCYWFGATNTHRLWEKGSGKALWNIEPDTLQGRLPKCLPDVPEVREDFADMLGESQAWDEAVGIILKKLEAIVELENTMIVISGDHGAGGFPGAKCNLYDFGLNVSLAIWYPGAKGGRVVDDFVSLPDLCPTFLEAAGVPLPAGLNSRSLMPIIKSDQSGQIDPARTFAIAGRERHVAGAREGNLTYPQRSLRTADFLLIRNFKPDRWPMGAPWQVTETSAPSHEDLAHNTFCAFPDMDAGEIKAWLVEHRNDPQWRWYYDYAFAKRPEFELYDVRKDPDQIHNVAADPMYADARARLTRQLMDTLTAAGDPRVTGDGQTFEKPPFTDPEAPRQGKGKGKGRAAVH
ncbi:MAG: betC 1 [Verrucomicrobiaceae bacterium]|nr:betC 1 [Verrucomicrobiaceae bacterium]